ncbi:MAG: alpha-amylase family glycosyl hydrolase [Caldilineaceae bacterium]
MFDDKQLARETQRTYARVLPRLEQRFAAHLADPVWQVYRQRLDAHFPQLFTRLLALYGDRYDFYYHLETVLDLTARSWLDRPDDLKTLDAARAADPAWYQREQMLGGVCYVDLFAGDLQHLRARIPYFQELGLTYLHLMPLFKAPEGDNDGGCAEDYRQVDPDLGTMADLETLATELRAAGISLVLDFVFNHTSDEHRWASRTWRRSRARRLLLPLPRPHHARCLRPHPARDLPGPTPGQLHLSPGDRPVGLDDVQPFPVGSQLSQPRSSTTWRRRCSSWPTSARRCCGWMRWPSPGRSWAPTVRVCPRRTRWCRPSTRCCASPRPRCSSSPRPSSIPTR